MRNTLWGVFGARRSLTAVVAIGLASALAVIATGVVFVWMSAWNVGGDIVLAYGVAGIVFAGMMAWQACVRGPVEIGDTVWAGLDVAKAAHT